MTWEKLTAVSLFAGVGGFDLAMQRYGIDVVATVEIDKNARGVLQHRFANTKHFTDVTEVTSEQLLNAGFVPERGIITGGFPCQDLSVAGKRAGLGGARSGLFWEIVRLLDELQPKFFVLENVPGLLSSNEGRDFGTVLAALVERGYGVAYRILDAQHFGVPQRRRRVFIVGCFGDDGSTPAEILSICESLRGYSAPDEEAGQSSSDDATERAGDNGSVGTLTEHLGSGGPSADEAGGGHPIPFIKTGSGRLVDGEEPPDQWEERYVTNTLTSMENSSDLVSPTLVTRTLTARYDSSETGDGGFAIVPFVKVARGGDETGEFQSEERWSAEEVAPTLNVLDQGEGRANTLVAFGHTNGMDLEVGDTSPVLRANSQGAAVSNEMGVRRLTPVECERLQGFPPGWTEYRLSDKGELGKSPDSARYKQLGNAVAVPVVEWIMGNLTKAWSGDTVSLSDGKETK